MYTFTSIYIYIWHLLFCTLRVCSTVFNCICFCLCSCVCVFIWGDLCWCISICPSSVRAKDTGQGIVRIREIKHLWRHLLSLGQISANLHIRLFQFVSAIVLSAFSGICVYDYPEIRNICIVGMHTYIFYLKARTPLQSQESHGNFFVVYPIVFFCPFCIPHPSVFHFALSFPHKRYLFTSLIFPQYHANASGFNCCHFIPTWNGQCLKKSGFSTEMGLQAN